MQDNNSVHLLHHGYIVEYLLEVSSDDSIYENIEISIYRFRYRYIVSYRIVEKDIEFFDISRYFLNIEALYVAV